MPAQVDPELARRLESDPEAELEAIVLAAQGLDELLESLPEGVAVEQRFRLIKGIAVKASARALRQLAEMPAVKSMEPVREVQAWRSEKT